MGIGHCLMRARLTLRIENAGNARCLISLAKGLIGVFKVSHRLQFVAYLDDPRRDVSFICLSDLKATAADC